jgi:WXG100 family type VII secretion target
MTSDPGMLNIRFETLGDAQGDLAAAYVGAQATIDDLKAKLAGSLSLWTGDARAAYDQVQREWDMAFAHMAAVLQRAHVHLGNASDMYQAVERQNTSIWNTGG